MKTFEGIVVSAKMQKTAVVEVTRKTPHPMYKKLLKKSKKHKADTGTFTVTVGNRVKITETKPTASTKHFKITEVLK
ncbi:MAG TPA: 30S ribosomal protein S17 [Candidatus Saccharimonadales bacterium]|nr:30S ribosomal protein S17 [Candidatus Saccharimonadales bacterium]